MHQVFNLILILTVSLTISYGQQFLNLEHSQTKYWQDVKAHPDPNDPSGKRVIYTGWFRQSNIDTRSLAQGEIRALVEGKWQKFQVRELPPDFLEWNFSRRLAQLQQIKAMATGQAGGMPEIAGPHNGIVASHGARRLDTEFTINNAVKGIGWLPKPAKLPEIIALLQRTWNDSIAVKLSILDSLYRHGSDIFDLTKQTSLELYSRPNFETHTFLNQMQDAGVALVFLDLPKSYELRCIAQMLHPADPHLSAEEKQIVTYVNLIHDYFHGASPQLSIVVIYHVVQVFDNSPGRWRGQRIIPPLKP